MSIKPNVKYTNEYENIAMLMVLLTIILNNLIIRSLSIRVSTFENNIPQDNNPNLATPLHRQNEDDWILVYGLQHPMVLTIRMMINISTKPYLTVDKDFRSNCSVIFWYKSIRHV
jgi:hypothetical protein